ncbi:hypothetical protein [Nocardia sp. NPDC058497]|uniref:hypothetical protein n=1 Tax=Nocardia sp. NPDC058497 TaxID=3346529 RepID=UPI0036475E52
MEVEGADAAIDYGLMWPTADRNPLLRPFIDTIRELASTEIASPAAPDAVLL